MKAIFIPLVLFLTSVNAQSLEEHLKEAGENNPTLKAKYLAFEGAMQNVTRANALPDPSLSFGYFVSPVETRVGAQQLKVSLTQMFPWFGTLSAKGNSVKFMAESKYQIFLDAKNELYHQVKSVWYQLFTLHKTVEIQKENKEVLMSFKQIAITGFKNAKNEMVDVLRADIMVEQVNTEILLLEHKKAELTIRFNSLLNRTEPRAIEVPDSIPLSVIKEGYRREELFSGNPLVSSFDLQIKSAEAQGKVSKKAGLPKLGVGLDYVVVAKRTDVDLPDNGKDIFMPMVSLSLPIFRKKYKAAVKRSQFYQAEVLASKEAYENSLADNYATTWLGLLDAKERMALSVIQVAKTRQAVRLLLASYSNSGKDFKEILIMQKKLLAYQIAEVIAKKEYRIALSKLDYLTAKPFNP